MPNTKKYPISHSPFAIRHSTFHISHFLFAICYLLFACTNPVADTITPEGPPAFIDSQYAGHLVYVPSGSFEMGKDLGTAATGDVAPVHTVNLTGFYMAIYPVTQAQYEAVMGTNPSYFKTANGRAPAEGETDAIRPVERVSWYDAIVFCNKLSMLEDLTPAYSIDGSTDPADWGTIPTSSNETWNAVQMVAGSTGYRLPTEAQWEYAAKGGNGTPGNCTYSGSNDPEKIAWYDLNSGSRTHEVGKKLPNGLGIYDMSGNVWEYCWDRWGSYTSEEQTDPTGPTEESSCVIRGGCRLNEAVGLRTTYRNPGSLFAKGVHIGFRLVLPGGF